MSLSSATSGRFLGKYRATVQRNDDPDQRGRLQLTVPDVLGPVTSTWAEACVPLAGGMGPSMGVYMVPPVGAGVWVEFERGDPNYPVWVGCRWGGASDLPAEAKSGQASSPNIVVQTLGQHQLVLSDAAPSSSGGGIVLKSAGGATVVVNDSGIYIDNGKGAKITLTGSNVSVNDGALAVS